MLESIHPAEETVAGGVACTLSGSPIPPLTRGLPKTVDSICPECLKVVRARYFVEDGRVMSAKTCPDHGTFRDLVFSDAELYLELEDWHFGDGRGLENPQVRGAARCPSSCGICNMHTTHTSLANVDLTARCNLSCNVCFADSNTNPYEPSYEEIVCMLERLRAQRPAPAATVQYTGGEPTVHPRFMDIVRKTRELGFTHIQCATNGLRFADKGFAAAAREAGLQYLYLQIDGTDDAVYEKIRGRGLFDRKLAAIEGARAAGLRIIFVPTIVRGVNDGQIGPLLRLAFENLDVVTGISIQPVVFTGRYPEAERLEKRYTLGDMARDVSLQTGLTDPRTDWFPVSSATPFVKLGMALTGRDLTNHTCHHHCVIGTLLFVDRRRRAVPVTRFLDYKKALADIDALAARASKRRFRLFSDLKLLSILKKHFHGDRAPEGLTFRKFLRTLDGYTDKKYSWDEAHKGHTYKTFFILGMHFMDNYNYSIERVRRCAVHYSASNGRLYPFCTYNSGHTFRRKVERAWAEAAGGRT
ncbi:MAG TPA: radical SAM protein [Deltaproteobacteria bacterium]|nr:radical SAM protein [Deltaproteobacteria bacterium]